MNENGYEKYMVCGENPVMVVQINVAISITTLCEAERNEND